MLAISILLKIFHVNPWIPWSLKYLWGLSNAVFSLQWQWMVSLIEPRGLLLLISSITSKSGHAFFLLGSNSITYLISVPTEFLHPILNQTIRSCLFFSEYSLWKYHKHVVPYPCPSFHLLSLMDPLYPLNFRRDLSSALQGPAPD